MLYRPEKERLWDTWIVPHDGQFYLYYIRVSEGGTRWDGVSLAVSDDLLHWIEKGTVLEKHPDAIWLGTGMIQNMGTHFIMNFSEERPENHQVICFAESNDLIHWNRLENELHPDPQYYITNRSNTCDFLYRWDSIGILDALTAGKPPYYGFITASVHHSLPGKTGAIGLATSKDGKHWKCMPHANAQMEYGAYEVPEHVQFNDRHYIIFSSSEYLSGRYSSRARFLEGGCYYVVSKDALSGYVSPPCDPMLIGTRDYESPCMKTVARIIRHENDVIVYYHWGDLSGNGWIGIPLVLKEIRPWELKLFYWSGAERLKGDIIEIELDDCEPIRKVPEDISSRVITDIAQNSIHFQNAGSADGFLCRTPASVPKSDEDAYKDAYKDGRVFECTLRIDSGIGAGVVFESENKHYLVYFSFKEAALKFGYVRSGWMANLSLISFIESKQTLGYGIPHRVRIIYRKFFVEVYIDDVYADGFRYDSEINSNKIGFYFDQSSGLISEMNCWQMK
ncbi:MAG: hypothetical protein ACOX63_01785 [Christensenellales bacterium]|jgi:hypothetical protein